MKKDIFKHLNDGIWVHGGVKDYPEVGNKLGYSAGLCHELNQLHPSDTASRCNLLHKLLGSIGDSFTIHSPFRCDFGFNIHIGDNFVGNFNLSILDEAEVRIGNNVMIGPNCSLITINHALCANQRNDGIMSAKPIVIEDNVWIGGGVTVLPGVTIGMNSVIGAGSVVVKSIPPDMIAVGNPCKPLRKISEADYVTPEDKPY